MGEKTKMCTHPIAKEINDLLNSITHLTFDYYFNQPVDKLPNGITHLTFGICFNQTLDGLPYSVCNITFYYYYKFISSIPDHITIIKIIYREKIKDHKPIDNLPIHIKEIHTDLISTEQVKIFNKLPFGCKVYEDFSLLKTIDYPNLINFVIL